MKRHHEQAGSETMSKRRRGFQLRDPGQAWRTHRPWRAAAQRPLPLRLRQAVQALLPDLAQLSSIAATTRAETTDPAP